MAEPTTTDADAPPLDISSEIEPEPTPTPRPPASGPGGGLGTDAQLADRLDRLNLEQALLDFATANARVLDLTRRVCTLNDEVVELRNANVRQAIELERLRRLEQRLRAVGVSQGVSSAKRLARVGRKLLRGLR